MSTGHEVQAKRGAMGSGASLLVVAVAAVTRLAISVSATGSDIRTAFDIRTFA